MARTFQNTAARKLELEVLLETSIRYLDLWSSWALWSRTRTLRLFCQQLMFSSAPCPPWARFSPTMKATISVQVSFSDRRAHTCSYRLRRHLSVSSRWIQAVLRQLQEYRLSKLQRHLQHLFSIKRHLRWQRKNLTLEGLMGTEMYIYF